MGSTRDISILISKNDAKFRADEGRLNPLRIGGSVYRRDRGFFDNKQSFNGVMSAYSVATAATLLY